MSARRQASTTSLSRFQRNHTPDFADRSLDFCNAFWGTGDAGVDVLFARMRGAIRTMEELRNFWKERAMIEEQYAKRLAGLAKITLGKDEIGELRNSLETLRLETEKQASFHMHVAQQVKNDLEAPANALLNRQLHHKKTYQSAIEREFKMKQQQESLVARAREKYEADCLRINSYTAQSTIMQGKELEKIQSKLERAYQTVGANEQDFQKLTRILQETTTKWEQDWKEFCDRCQDLEEERLEFMKDNMWAYANVISTVCVSDDESCERVRLALEQLEPEKDMETFVYNYGTGNAIPNPPVFINYAKPDTITTAMQRPGSRPANFQRVTDRPRDLFPPPQPPVDDDLEPRDNTAGIGAGGGRAEPPQNQSRPASRASSRHPAPTQQPATTSAPNGRGINVNRDSVSADPNAEPIGANEQTMLKVGDRAYPVDLSNNPQEQRSAANGGAPARVGQDDDPLARQMEALRAGSIRRSQQSTPQEQQQQPQQRPTHQPKDSASQLSPPPGGRGGGPPNKRDYRLSAEIVVGGPPPTASRPASPNPPTAVLAMPPPSAQQQDQTVQNVLADYAQSFPGERKSVSRPGSRAGSISGPQAIQPPQTQPTQPRHGASDSMAGVGAQGRSPSPQPFRPPSRAPSPAQQQQHGVSPGMQRNVSPAVQPGQAPPQTANARRNSFRTPTGAVGVATPFAQANGALQGPGHNSRQSSISQQQRPVSPNPVGIQLDPSGRVVADELAERYRYQQQPAAAAPQQQPYRGMQQQPVRQGSYPPVQQAPPPQPQYGSPPPAQTPMYGQGQGYVQQAPPPPQQAPPPQQYPQSYQYGQPPVQPPVQQDYGRAVNGPARTQSVSYGQPPQQQPPYGNGVPQQYAPQGYAMRDPSPMRAPSPQPPAQAVQQSPTGAYTDDGRPILFYVTALYDYQAVIDEEFDFQAGDVIAVTATPEDGWWSGELLDEARKQPGRHVFPSNFVRLL